MLNLAWMLLFKDIYTLLFGKDPGLVMRAVIAVLFTVVSSGISTFTMSGDAILVDESND
jgi:hypothetical protein